MLELELSVESSVVDKPSSAYICGVARNCAPYLPSVLANIQTITTLLDSYKIIIVVAADSTEDIHILTAFAQQHSNNMILYIDNAPQSPVRTVNIARARNICLTIMRKLTLTHSYPYFIMMDCDDVCSAPINDVLLKKVLNAGVCEDKWDALSFNQLPYYDVWALAVPPFIFSYSNFGGGNSSKIKWQSQLQWLFKSSNVDMVPVWSAFGGFAIYKSAMFLQHYDLIYDGTYRIDYIPAPLLSQNIQAAGPIYKHPNPTTPFLEPGADCEHRYFHLMAVLKYEARIFIHRKILFEATSVKESS